MLAPEFSMAALAWVSAETLMERKQSRSTSLASAVMPGASSSVLDEALRVRPLFFDPVADVRAAVLGELSKPEGVSAIYTMAIAGVQSELRKMIGLSDALGDTLEGLSSGLENPPAEASEEQRRAAIESVRDVASMMEEAARGRTYVNPDVIAAQTADAILSLVDAGVLDPDEVSAWLDKNPIARQVYQGTMSQIVDSVGDRVWRIARAEPTGTQAVSPGSRPTLTDAVGAGVELVDEQGQVVVDLSGAVSATLSEEGVMIVRGGPGLTSNASRTLTLRAVTDAPLGRVPQTPSLKVGVTNVLTNARTNLEDTYKFDVWACIVLDLASKIQQDWDALVAAMRRITAQLRNALIRVLSGSFLLALPSLEVDWRGPIRDLLALAQRQLPDGGAGLQTLLSIVNQLRPVAIGDNNLPLCDLEQGKYCEAHTALLNLGPQLDALLQKVQFRLSGQDAIDLLDLLGYDPLVPIGIIEDALAPIEQAIQSGEALVARVRGDVCAWVRRRQQGVPASISLLSAVLIQMAIVLPAALAAVGLGSLGIPPVTSLLGLSDKLQKMGFGSMATDLRQMNLDSFFGGLDGATEAGKVSRILGNAAATTQYIDRASRLQALSDATAARNNQAVNHQKTRSMVRARYHAPSSAGIARAVSAEAGPLVLEVDREASRR